ncbi:MAG: ferritin-like domain-containing protein, partial [Edaphobacter sp.]
MATQETKQFDEIISSRRAMMTMGGAALAGLILTGTAKAAAAITDTDVLNFALNLEYLEAQFYNLAAFGVTIDKLPTPVPIAVNGGTAGSVALKPGFAKVPFTNPLISAYAMETAIEER